MSERSAVVETQYADRPLIDELTERRDLDPRARRALLVTDVPAKFLGRMIVDGLNPLEMSIALVLFHADRDGVVVDTVEIGQALKQRSGDVAKQMPWLEKKRWVTGSLDEGQKVWELTK